MLQNTKVTGFTVYGLLKKTYKVGRELTPPPLPLTFHRLNFSYEVVGNLIAEAEA